jgi:acetyl esterase/lipase
MSKRTVAVAVGAGATVLGAHVARSYLAFPADLRSLGLLRPYSVRGPRSLARLRAWTTLPTQPHEGVTVTLEQVSRADRSTVGVLRHEPAGRRTPTGALLWLHGGGYVAGAAAADTVFCSRVAAELGVPVFAVDYRLAPEHPFPGALEDAYAALVALDVHAAGWGIDPRRIAAGGASAGGGLAAALCQLARDRGATQPCFQLLRYPMLDDRTTRGRLRRHYVWTPASNRFGWRSYLGRTPGATVQPRYAVPARTTDLAGLPPTRLGVGDADLFYDEGLRYVAALEEAGVPVVLDVEDGMFHGADGLAATSPRMQAFAAREIAALREALTG